MEVVYNDNDYLQRNMPQALFPATHEWPVELLNYYTTKYHEAVGVQREDIKSPEGSFLRLYRYHFPESSNENPIE